MKLLIDMNLSPRWRAFMEGEGVSATHWSQVGKPTAADAEIMAYAASGDFVVLTHDLDFGAILAATGGRKPSVVQLRADNISPEAIGATTLRALRQCEAELVSGALLTIDVVRFRLNLLPLGGSNG